MTISTSPVTGVDFVCLPTHDLDAARAIGIEFQATKVALHVEDTEAARAELETRGGRSSATRWTWASVSWRRSASPTPTRSCCTTATHRVPERAPPRPR